MTVLFSCHRPESDVYYCIIVYNTRERYELL